MLLIYATINLYDRAYSRGWWSRLWATLWGRPSRLLDLATLRRSLTIHNRHFIGRQTVPIRQIRGSEGRGDEFDTAFYPRKRHTEERWRNIARMWLAGVELPPVELIRVGDIYFVRDGHHRISVAAAVGQRDIDALVTVWQVEGQIPWEPPAQLPQQDHAPCLSNKTAPVWGTARGFLLRSMP
jgi:hypothetical protein